MTQLCGFACRLLARRSYAQLSPHAESLRKEGVAEAQTIRTHGLIARNVTQGDVATCCSESRVDQPSNIFQYHHPFKVTFLGGPYQNVRYLRYIKIHKIHRLGPPPLNVKLVAERPQGVDFVGRSQKYFQHVCLHVQGPPQKHLETCSLHFGYVPPP